MDAAVVTRDATFERQNTIMKMLNIPAIINGAIEVRFDSVFNLKPEPLCVDPGSTETTAL